MNCAWFEFAACAGLQQSLPKSGRIVRQSQPKSAPRTFPAEKRPLRAASRRRSHGHAIVATHLTAELALTSKRSVASRRDAPISTGLIMHSRSSPEQGFGIPNPRKGESMHEDALIYRPWESLRFKSLGYRFSYYSPSNRRPFQQRTRGHCASAAVHSISLPIR